VNGLLVRMHDERSSASTDESNVQWPLRHFKNSFSDFAPNKNQNRSEIYKVRCKNYSTQKIKNVK
jgi:hypothetical protein